MNFVFGVISLFKRDKVGLVGAILFLFFLCLSIAAPYVAPYDPNEMLFEESGELARLRPPSKKHLFGTTSMGRDIFSQVVMGSRVAMIVGVISAICVVFIGTSVGIVSGYYGGRIDNTIMRFVDIVYGIPFLPFALVLIIVIGPGLSGIILAIVLITWRNTARIIRSQVLSVRRRTFIEAAKSSGASDIRIMVKYIFPNVMPLSLVYVALSMGSGIMTEASLSFLGFGDPLLPSWGKILFECYSSQAMMIAWWWMIPPGTAILLLVLSGYLIGRSFEEIADPRLRENKSSRNELRK
jgi:peptide/nickel transport system permease protein